MQTLAQSVRKPAALNAARGDFYAALYGSKVRNEIIEEAHHFLEKNRDFLEKNREQKREQKKLPRILRRTVNRKKENALVVQPVEPVETIAPLVVQPVETMELVDTKVPFVVQPVETMELVDAKVSFVVQPVETMELVGTTVPLVTQPLELEDTNVPLGVTKLPPCPYMCVRQYVPPPKTHSRRAKLPFDCLTFLALHNSNGRLVRESVIHAFVEHYFPACRTIKTDAWMNGVRRELMKGKNEFIMISNPECRGNTGDAGAFWALAEDVEANYARKLTAFCQKYKNISNWGIADPNNWNEILAGVKGYPKQIEESSLRYDMVTVEYMQKPGFWKHNEFVKSKKECPTCEHSTAYAKMMEKKRTAENIENIIIMAHRKEKISEPPAKRTKLTKDAENYTAVDGRQYCYENETTSGELATGGKDVVCMGQTKVRQYYAIKTHLTYKELKKEKSPTAGEYYFDEDEMDEDEDDDLSMEAGYVQGTVATADYDAPVEGVQYCEQQQQYMAPMEHVDNCNIIEEYIPSEEFQMQHGQQPQAVQQMQQQQDVHQMQQPHFGEQQNFHDMPVLSQEPEQHYFMNNTENHFPSSASSPDSGFFSHQGDVKAMEATYEAQAPCPPPHQSEFPPLDQFVFKDNNSLPMGEDARQNTLPLGDYDDQQSWMDEVLFPPQEIKFLREENPFGAMSNCFDAFDEFFPQLNGPFGAPVM